MNNTELKGSNPQKQNFIVRHRKALIACCGTVAIGLSVFSAPKICKLLAQTQSGSTNQKTLCGWESYKWDIFANYIRAIGSLGFVVTGYLAWKSLQVAEGNRLIAEEDSKQTSLNAQKNRELAERKQVTELFAKATEMLSSGRLESRIGGIYLFERIAKDSKNDHPVVMEVLSTFIRENAPADEPEDPMLELAELESQIPEDEMCEDVPLYEQCESIKPDIQAALSVIARRDIEKDNKTQRIDLSGSSLNFAKLGNAKLQTVILQNSSLKGAQLTSAKLDNAFLDEVNFTQAILIFAELPNTKLRRAIFEGATLEAANLSKADLEGADLYNADLRGATLTGTNLREANLREANLTKANIQIAKLQDAGLYQADLESANLIRAELQGANFREAKLNNATLTEANIENATLLGTELANTKFDRAQLQGTIFGYNTGLSDEQKQDFTSRGATFTDSTDASPQSADNPDDQLSPDSDNE